MRHVLAIALLSLLLPSWAIADGGCVDPSAIVGECTAIRGRLTLDNGRTRIWPVGTQRLLGVPAKENETPVLPKEVAKILKPDEGAVFGNFVVCPLSAPRAGEMQWVCIKSAENLVVRER